MHLTLQYSVLIFLSKSLFCHFSMFQLLLRKLLFSYYYVYVGIITRAISIFHEQRNVTTVKIECNVLIIESLYLCKLSWLSFVENINFLLYNDNASYMLYYNFTLQRYIAVYFVCYKNLFPDRCRRVELVVVQTYQLNTLT